MKLFTVMCETWVTSSVEGTGSAGCNAASTTQGRSTGYLLWTQANVFNIYGFLSPFKNTSPYGFVWLVGFLLLHLTAFLT